MSEKQNNFVKIWAVVAPLAALAGLYYVHSRRRRTDAEYVAPSIKEVAKRVDPPQSSKKAKAASKTAALSSEEKEKVPEKAQEDVSRPRVDSGISTMDSSNSQAPELVAPETIEECSTAQLEAETPQVETNTKKEDPSEDEEEEELITVSKEVVCVNSAPAVLMDSPEPEAEAQEDTEEIVEEIVTEEKVEVEAVNGRCSSEKSYEIIECAEVNGEEDSRESLEFEIDTKEPLTNVTEIVEEESTSTSASLTTGASGATAALPKHMALDRRTRTESENRDWDNWADSPTMKVKNTPVVKENGSSKSSKSNGKAKENGNTPNSRNSERKSKNGSSNGLSKKAKNLKKVMEASNENDNRDSTTPDSAKESDASKTKSKKRRNGKKKKSSSTSTSKSSVKAPSSDSGTATDDNIERYMEISGFPASMVGALIGRSGKNIKTIQEQSKCKVLVKEYPVEGGGQYIAIEGTSKNILKAVKILKERFPDVNFSQELLEETLSNSPLVPQEPAGTGYEDYYFDYSATYEGPTNNEGQVELVRGVPVEVRVTSLGPDFNDVWLQPYTHPSHDKFYSFESSMCEFYNADESISIIPPSQYLPFGSYAAVLHHTTDEITGKEVGKWYRVQIYQYTDDYNAMVLYLDFGNYASVPTEMIRQLMPEFHPHECGIPFQVVHAQLEGVENPTDNVMGPVVYDIIRKSPQSSLVAEVTGYDELAKPVVKLMYYTGGQKVLINDIVNETVTALKRKQSKSAESIKPWFDNFFQQLQFLNQIEN
ncbi:Oidioi.mRNA.OKI2018_I69.PAR.g12539.t1.cds [Oikopleura dioica]|uniref:Oidioi.mRNA.OKI2018_I69.PAR.g12539.t1.cds n=1 Tax=Oikopleura dioica TaxID=34765 RepID=A0ABN7S0E0_OIKDI|nr:Oidioi.mRNA.OKI2018_I69.PAR.g12539.t1.cds [Oikopleura dioica]